MTEIDTMVQRVALVTGANRGLGRAIARALAEQGIHVALTARSERGVSEQATILANEGLPVSAHQLDVTDPASVVRAVADTAHRHGRLDILVNNAGIAIDRDKTASVADFERVLTTLNTNIVGAWRCCCAAIPEMRRNAYGRIVNVTSHLGTFAKIGTGSAAYRVSKVGLNALTHILAAELHDDNILVNAASPGKVDSRITYGKVDTKPEEATDTFTWLATLPDDGPTGKLFHNRQPMDW